MTPTPSLRTYVSRVSAIVFAAVTLLFAVASRSEAQTAVVQINAGGGAVSPFVADTDFNAGNQFSSTNTISTSGVTNPAPTAVYQSVRWNSSFTYTIPNLTAGNSYLVRLHFVELTWTASGQRLFNVAINGTNVLSNFDIFAAVGQNHALVKEFTATANASGQIVIAFTQGTADNPSVAGIEVDTPAATTRSPYGGSNWSVANGSKIEAENYDLGGEGVAYHDTDATNNGGQYRTDGVDIESTTDTGGGYDVGWINDGEWLDYTVNTTAGNYNIVIRGASAASPASGSVKVVLDGVVLGQVSIPNTGGWQSWQDFTISNVSIAAGTGRTLQLQFVGGGFNVNNISFAAVASGRTVYGGTTPTINNGAVIQAENFDNGGEGVAYHDTDAANQGGQYRTTEGVDIEACSDTGGGYDVGWINDGEWMDYYVNTTAGTYNIVVRGASLNNPSSGTVKVVLDGTVLGQVNVAYTGGWQTWQDFTIPNVTIAAGSNRTLQLQIVGGGFNINYVKFTTGSSGNPPATPTGLTANPGNGSVGLSWSASSGATTYNVYRSTTSGGEGSTAYASNISSTSYTDTGVTNGTTYYYKVAAVNSYGTSGQSSEVAATPSGGGGGTPNTAVIQINAGGGAVSPFVADTDFDVGTQFSSTATISTAGTNNAAPAAVYQSVRWNSAFNYTIGGLTAGTSYVVRLHFVELSFTTSGSRKFNVAINGTTVLSAFDVFAAAGQNHALEKEFNATANGSGQIVVAFSQGGADNPDVAGIEIWTQPPLPGTPTNLVTTAGNGQVSMTWTGSSNAASYIVYRGTSSNGESGTPIATNVTTTNFTDATVTNGTTYYYKVAAVNSAGVSAQSNEASATPTLPPPPAPTGLTAAPGNAQVSLSWSASSGATSYNVYRGTTAGGESGTAIATGITSAFYTDTGLTNGTTYYYKVAAVNSAGTSPQSSEASATPAVVTSQAVEAETAFSSGGPSVATSLSGYSGTGYVTGFSATGARTLFTANVAAATTSSIAIRYQNTSGSSQSLSLYVNNERIGQVSLPSGSGWQTASASAVLHSGLNLIGLQRDSADSASSVALDKIDVSGASPLAARGATTPYTTYEAEDASVASTNGSVLTPDRTYLTLASESSGRSAVQLTQTGHYVQFTLRAPANAMVVRYCIPDSADGTGLNATLSLYANGTKVQTLAVSSKYAWVYGAYPYDNNPGDGSPHHFYSESNFLIGNWPTGTVLKLQKDSGDTAASYTIDLVDFEQVDAAATMPSGYISIEQYGATANDGTDDTTAINNAIAAAASGNKKVWIPAGTYNISSRLNVANVEIRGAGPWYSILQGANGKGGLFATGSNVTLADFTLSGDVTYRNDAGFDSAVEGNFGTGSTIFNMWLRRAKVGMWIDSGTNGLYVGGVRIRDMFADGVNLHANVQNTRIDQSSIRNTGDDALAMWSDGSAVTNCAFTFNTSQLPMLANTAGIYGGSGNSITDCLMSDTVTACAGIAVSTRFNPVAFSGTTTVARNTLTRTGGWEPNWLTQLGALWIYTDTLDITTPVVVKDTSIIDTTYQAVLISYGKTVSGLLLDHLTIQTAGTYGIQVNNESGSGTVQNTSISGAASGAISNPGTTFTLTLGSGNTGF